MICEINYDDAPIFIILMVMRNRRNRCNLKTSLDGAFYRPDQELFHLDFSGKFQQGIQFCSLSMPLCWACQFSICKIYNFVLIG